MNERSSGFLGEVLHRYLGSGPGPWPRMRRADLERLLTGDTHRRVAHARAAAMEWAATEITGTVEITSERLLITPRGLLYAAQVSGPSSRWALYYLAVPPPLLDPIVDRVGAAQLPPGSAAAVDSRFGHDLEFPWPLDAPLRRTLDAHEVLRLQ